MKSRLIVIAAILTLAALPGTASATMPIGDQFRISMMGQDGDAERSARFPAIAYDPTLNRYLVVWSGDDVVFGEYEIYGRFIDSQINAVTPQFRISKMGHDFDTNYDAYTPTISYNSKANEYLVTWAGDNDAGGLINDEYEIFSQRLASNGLPVGAENFRISDMGDDGNNNYGASDPVVTYNPHANEYLVVWKGDDNSGSLVDEEFEVFIQRLKSNGDEIGINDLRISDMGPDGIENFGASQSAISYNSQANEYLVIWFGDDNTNDLVDDEFEIFGQRLGATANEIGINDFRISDMGPYGDANYDAYDPAITYNSQDNEYFATWRGDDSSNGLVDEELEIYGQRIGSDGSPIGENDFRISDMGDDGNTNYGAAYPAISYNSQANEYLVTWAGDDDSGGLINNEIEIFGQRLTSNGDETGNNDFRISEMGHDGSTNYGAYLPDISYNSQANEYLVTWFGDDNTNDLVDNEYEIFGRRIRIGAGEPQLPQPPQQPQQPGQPLPPPPPTDQTAPKLKLRLYKLKLGKKSRKKGARARLSIACDEQCSASYKLKTKGIKLKSLLQGSSLLTATKTKKVTLRLSRGDVKKLIRKYKKLQRKRPKRKKKRALKIEAAVEATDTAGNRSIGKATANVTVAKALLR